MATTTSVRGTRRARARQAGSGLALAVLAAVAVAGCGGSDKEDGAPSHSGPASASRSAQPSGGSSGDASASASASAKPSVSAADGRDAGACADGNCEIAVSEPVTVRFKGPAGPATLSVTEVGPNKVEYTVQSSGGRSQGEASGPGQGCITVLRDHGSANSCGRPGKDRPAAQPNAVVIQMTAGEDGTAILHIVSG
ncbi:hypothetical protein QFW82_38290 [Streptomyces malaysiensis subsp. malaysiensis]|uniref:hypothetical protein n=1 Tax=Streptomyces malaysiensis TaxID=92644 RepID=UPI0024C0B8CB|nr:hypothetical protein [Streptomyces sp. NA07423]WHX22463.1 hypothetical protein QFW82_38290 [Streptomyces sp. NA07423]